MPPRESNLLLNALIGLAMLIFVAATSIISLMLLTLQVIAAMSTPGYVGILILIGVVFVVILYGQLR